MAQPNGTDVDFFLPLSWRAVVLTLVGCLVGVAAGFGMGFLSPRSYQARSVIRVASVSPVGPVVPLNELRARAESRMALRQLFKEMGEANPGEAAGLFRVQAEVDPSADGGLMTFTVFGLDRDRTAQVCERVAESIVKRSHEAFEAAVREQNELKAQAQGLLEARRAAAGALADRLAQAQQLERLAEDSLMARRLGERLAVQARDAETIDSPEAQEQPSKKTLLAALGAFAGMFLGLVLSRPFKRG